MNEQYAIVKDSSFAINLHKSSGRERTAMPKRRVAKRVDKQDRRKESRILKGQPKRKFGEAEVRGGARTERRTLSKSLLSCFKVVLSMVRSLLPPQPMFPDKQARRREEVVVV